MLIQYSTSTATLLKSLVVYALCNSFVDAAPNVRISEDAFNVRLDAAPSVKISEGTVSGVHSKTHNQRTISAFLGIPFAEPPVGDLRLVSKSYAKVKMNILDAILLLFTRFANPESKRPWNGTYKAVKDGSMCPQTWGDSVNRGREDCLYLNVFTPKV